MRFTLSHRLATIACCLAFVVILLGAYTRLTDAGLGCPDWPGCYGHLIASQHALNAEQSVKAWTEMIHRYVAMILGILIVTLFILSLRLRKTSHPKFIPSILIVLLIFQAALGMWTVTLKLHPLVVMAHLLGGLTLLSLLWLLRLQLSDHIPPFEKGGLGGILGVAKYYNLKPPAGNPPQPSFFKGGDYIAE